MFIKVEELDLHAAIPRQVHLALTNDPRQMIVMWATRTSNTLSCVEVWPSAKPHHRKMFRGSISVLEGTPTVMHTVRLTGLRPGMKYSYRVGDPTIDTWCRDYWFETLAKNATNTRFVAVGDMDLEEDGTRRNLEFLKENIMEFDVVILLGDITYKFGSMLDDMGEALEPVTAIRPTMVLPGNHEWDKREGLGFHSYNARWHMPENGYLNQWYSFNLGKLHFVALSTEDSVETSSKQGQWLLDDLKAATVRGDWTVLMAHKTPIGSANKKWLQKNAHVLFEDLQHYLGPFNIKLALFGHIHLYERTHPVNGVVYITAGVGGARLDTEFVSPVPDWSAFRHAEHGACFFQFNPNTLEVTMQYRSAHDSRTIDECSIPGSSSPSVPHEALFY